MASIIDNFYYNMPKREQSEEILNIMKALKEKRQELISTLNTEQQMLLEEYTLLEEKLSAESSKKDFSAGFKLGSKLMKEMLN